MPLASIAPPEIASFPASRVARAFRLALAASFGAGVAACGDSGDPPTALPSAGAGGTEAGASNAGTSGASGTSGESGAAGASGAGGTSTAGTGGTGGEPPPGVGECNVRIVESPPTSANHELECSDLVYSTNPPSGGDHYGVWAAFQNYDVPVRAGFLVHALEHGAVVFWYNCPEGCADEVAEVGAFIAALPEDPLCEPFAAPRRAVLVPYPELDSRWAASAWGFALTADCFDVGEFGAFYADHAGQGPEQLCNNGQPDVATRCP